MVMFDELNAVATVNQIQQHLAALMRAFEACEDDYEWSSAYSQTDFEAPPLSMSGNASQQVLNALADVHDLYETAKGTPGFPLPALPYNFTASMRAVIGSRNP
jgi:hypothetical protein